MKPTVRISFSIRLFLRVRCPARLWPCSVHCSARLAMLSSVSSEVRPAGGKKMCHAAASQIRRLHTYVIKNQQKHLLICH